MPSKSKRKTGSPTRDGARPEFPTRKQIVEFLNQADGETSRRDIARAFGVTGNARRDLRALLKEMDADGLIDLKGGKRIMHSGDLPPVAPIDVMSVDDDGDLLAMPSNWRGDNAPPMIRIEARAASKMKPAPGVGDRLLARLKPVGDGGYEAQIIKAIGKGAHRFLAVFRKSRRGGIAEPVERRARNTFTIDANDSAGAEDGDLVLIETKNERGYGPKKARVRSIEGHVDDRGAYSVIALANQNIPTDFPAGVLKEAERAKTPPLGSRTDLRDMPLMTIDPADAKDHDDAIFAAPEENPDNPGGYKVVVAIADVSHFVPFGSALDKEAQKRGNSTYLPDRVAPMLPEGLSNDLCSLRAGEDRPCLAVELILSADGRKRSHTFMRAMMRSAAKLSYEEAQAMIDGSGPASPFTDHIKTLHAAFQARWKERQKRAPLDLDLPERKIIFAKNGTVARVARRERFDAHRIVEEFMILANVATAETLERARLTAIYRVHDQPDPEKLEATRKYLGTLDYSLVKGGSVRPSHFNQILKIAGARDEKEIVSEVLLRAQSQAIYDTENRGHFGLNLARYAHFTSPIRRYADLTVHRALIRAAKLGEDGQSDKEAAALNAIAEDISNLERRAMAAEREATDRYLADYLSGREGDEFDGRIRGVTRFGLFVALDETGADGFTPIRLLGDERFRFEEDRHALIGERTGGVYHLGQHVTVRLAEATPLTGGLRFDILTPPIKADGGARRKPKTAPQKNSKKKPSKKKSAKTSTRKKPKRSRSNAKPRARD